MTEKPKKKAILSKSTFIKGMQCPKALYLHKNRYFLRDPLSAEQLARFSRGTDVGIYAQNLFPGGVDASPKTHFQMAQSVVKTAALIQQPEVNVIYEAAFEHEEVIVALDILYRENNHWKGVEVKSSRSISETYRWDAALQYYVITGSGLELEDFSVAYINEDYKRQGGVDAHKLFHMESLLILVKERREEVAQKVQELKDVTRLKNSPPVPIGVQCNHPYPCDFRGHCWKKVPADSVFLLEGISEEQKFEWYHAGIASVDDLPAGIANDKNWSVQIQSIKEKKVIVDKPALTAFLQTCETARVFQPFLFAPVVPFLDNTSPYQALPFGNGKTHAGNSAPEIKMENYAAFSLEAAVENMLETTSSSDCLWVFGVTKIKELLANCKIFYPLLENDLELLSGKLKELLTPLERGMVVYPGMKVPLSPEKILKHFGAESAGFPDKCMIPEQADALFQKLISNPDWENNAGIADQLEVYMQSKTDNLFRLLQLWTNLMM